MPCIYSLNFQSGKRYIGMTSLSMPKRLAIHRMSLKSSEALLYRSWRKYGDPEVQILAFLEKHMLRDTERRAIAAYNTMAPNGYNLVAGGEGGGVSEESRLKMSAAGKGKPKSAEHRRKIGLGQIGRVGTWLGKKQPLTAVLKRAAANTGKKRSPEFRARMSAVAKGRTMSVETKSRISETMKAVRRERFWSSRQKEIQ